MIILNCPFSDKEKAKSLGARWINGHWQITEESYYDNPRAFSQWLSEDKQKELAKNMPAPVIDEIYGKLFKEQAPVLKIIPSERASRYQKSLSEKEFQIWNLICNSPYSEKSFDKVINNELVTEKTIFLDTETTGIHSPEIIELGIVNAFGKEIFHSFFKPSKAIERGASLVNNMTAEMLQYEPAFKDKWEEIQEILMGADKIYAYNSPYDVRIISSALEKNGIDSDIFNICVKKVIDAQPIAVNYAKENLGLTENKMKLQKFSDLLKLDYVEKHSASSDSYLILLCFNNMFKQETIAEIKTETPALKQKYKSFVSLEAMQAFLASVIDSGGSFVGYIPTDQPMLIYTENQ